MIILKALFLALITYACYKRFNEGHTGAKDILAAMIVIAVSWAVVLL